MNPIVRLCSASLLLALALAGLPHCSSSAGNPATSSGSSGGPGHADGPPWATRANAACSLLSATTAGQAFGTTFADGIEYDTSLTASAAQAEVVGCRYKGTGGWDVLTSVRYCPCGDNDPATTEQAAQSIGEVTSAVDGVGDSAFWAAPGPKAGVLDHTYQLNAFVGADLYVIVTVTTPDTAKTALDGATVAARSILAGVAAGS
jgi:hypothetical protein